MRVSKRNLGKVVKRRDGYWLVNMPEGLFEDNEMGPYPKLADLEEDRTGIIRFLQIAKEEGLGDEARRLVQERRHLHKPIRSRQKGSELL